MVIKKKKQKQKLIRNLITKSFCDLFVIKLINTVVNKKNSKWSNPINSSQQHVVVNKTSVCEREREGETEKEEEKLTR